MKKKILYSIILTGIALAVGCKKNPANPAPENELITTLKLTATDSATGTSYAFQFKDIDGDGGAAPTLDSVILPAGKVFNAGLLLLDERTTPADTTNKDIQDLNTIHQFFYRATPADVISGFTYKSFDDLGKPVGLLFRFVTNGTPATGTLRITLIHEVNKDGVNVVNNDVTNAGGSTDIQVDFPVRLY